MGISPGRGSEARFQEHVGELELALEADSLEDVFAEAARVVARECGRTEDAPGPWERIQLSARDPATLLVDWLNELIGRSEVEGRAYAEVQRLRLSAGEPATGGAGADAGEPGLPAADARPEPRAVAGLDAEVRGRPVREWESALKAATYHGLRLDREGGRWRARVLFDV